MSLEPFFNPRSVAIVGASRTPGKVGYEILAGMLKAGFPGRIYPVNPTSQEVQGIKAYAGLKDIGEPVDLAILVISAKHVPASMQAIALFYNNAINNFNLNIVKRF